MNPARAGIDPQEIVRVYQSGKNVMEYLRARQGTAENDPFTILASYDLQAGSYVRALIENPELGKIQAAAAAKFAGLFDRLAPDSILEVGVGEATTFANVLARMQRRPKHALGFDISVSRILVARDYLASLGQGATLFTGALEAIPLPAASIDVVYTSHSVEPNGGRERPILEELYRVARRYVVLCEPSNELGSEATQRRMVQHGYVQNLHATAVSLGYEVVEHSLWGVDANPQNQAALIVIRKPGFDQAPSPAPPALASPVSKRALVRAGGALYSEDDCLVFPILAGVPCLLIDNGVFCVRWLESVPKE